MGADLEGRIALVTGSSRGIGRAIALALAEDGADVCVHYNRDEEAAEETAAAIRALGRRVAKVRAGLDSFESAKHLVEAVRGELGDPDIVVHNAGVASRGKTVADTDPSEPEALFRIHAAAAFHLAQLALPAMRQRTRSDFVFVSSVMTTALTPNGAPYSMAKAALEALAYTLAKEERKNRVHVNLVAPGIVETDMGKRLVKAWYGVDDPRALDPKMPFGRMCQPEDVANAVRFLVSSRAAYLTAEKLQVHGGG